MRRSWRVVGFCWLLLVLLAVPSGAVAHDFHGRPHEGDGGDPTLNRLKNREEIPGEFEPIRFSQLRDFDVPEGIGKKYRELWPVDLWATV